MSKLKTLEEAYENSKNDPTVNINSAISEYLENLESENADKARVLKTRLEGDSNYAEEFARAITHTSLLITSIFIKITKPEQELLNLEKFIKEFLYFSRSDDQQIFDMRLYYLNNLSGEDILETVPQFLQQDNLDDTQKQEFLNKYQRIIKTITSQYKQRNPQFA